MTPRQRWFSHGSALLLAGVLAWAGIAKLADPPGFAQVLYHYRLFPAWSLHPLALVLPWLEVWTALALLVPRFRATGGRMALALLLAFAVGIGINLVRRHPIDCGCFGAAPISRTDAQRLRDMGWEVARDLVLAGLALHVARFAGKRAAL